MKRILFFILFISSLASAQVRQGPQGWYNVIDYGMYPDSTHGSTNQAILQSLVNNVPRGSTIYFPNTKGGSKWLITGGTINITQKITLEMPANPFDGTPAGYSHFPTINVIYHPSANDTLFAVNTGGVAFKNISILQNTASTTATGTAIYFQDGSSALIDNASIWQFGVGIEFKSGGEWVMNSASVFDCHVACVIIADTAQIDNGDALISGCGFGAGTSRATGSHELVRYISGGGLRFLNTKFNAVGGLVPDCIYAPIVGDLDISIVGCGFEGYSGSAFHMKALVSTGEFYNIVVTSNYMDGSGIGGHIVLDGSIATTAFYSGTITGNVFEGAVAQDTAILLNHTRSINISGNSYYQIDHPIVSISNPTSAGNTFDFPHSVQSLSESGRTIYMDLGTGTIGNLSSMTGNDTLRILPGNMSGFSSLGTGAGGADFKIIVTQDATGGRQLWIDQLYGQNFTKDYPPGMVIIDIRPNSATLITGYVNTNGYATITGVQYAGSDDHLIGQSPPGIAAKTAAGSGGTATLSSDASDIGGTITITTGFSPTANDTLVKITYSNGALIAYNSASIYQSSTSAVISPVNGAAAALSGTSAIYAIADKNGFYIMANTTPLAAGTVYKIAYITSGK